MKEYEGVWTKTKEELKKEKRDRENKVISSRYEAQPLKPTNAISILATSLTGFAFLATTNYA